MKNPILFLFFISSLACGARPLSVDDGGLTLGF